MTADCMPRPHQPLPYRGGAGDPSSYAQPQTAAAAAALAAALAAASNVSEQRESACRWLGPNDDSSEAPATVAGTTVVPRNRFFFDVMGIEESAFRRLSAEQQASFIVRPSNNDDPYRLKGTNGREFQAGRFYFLTLAALRDEALRVLASSRPGNGSISVIEMADDRSNDARNSQSFKGSEFVKRKVDIGSLQADPRNRGAVFGVASNYNCLETLGADDNIDQKALQDYLGDGTQGPFACTSAVPAIILRMYYLFAPTFPDRPNLWRQTQEHQLNLLEGFGVNMRSGYVVDDMHTLLRKLQAHADGGPLKIGFHANTQVTNGFMHSIGRDGRHELCTDRNQIINQAFAAALNLQGVGGGAAREAAQLILNWTYEAIIKAAFINAPRGGRVFLPKIGGGVFENDPAWIDDAIGAQMNFVKATGLQVVVNNFGEADAHSRERLMRLVEHTGGHYVRYHNDGRITELKRSLDDGSLGDFPLPDGVPGF